MFDMTKNQIFDVRHNKQHQNFDGSTKKVTLRNLINEKNENEPEE